MRPQSLSWADSAGGLPGAGSHIQDAMGLQRRHLELGRISKCGDDKVMTLIANQVVQTWHLRYNELLFTTTPREDEDMASHEVARMIEELGMPPMEFIDRLDLSQQYLDDCMKSTDGRPAARQTPSTKRSMPSDTAPEDFVVFMKKMLAWLPEERQSAEQLFADAWLNS